MKDYPDLDYPEGSLLVDVRYNTYPEFFEVIYLNPITNRLDVKYEEPLVDMWFLRERFRTNKFQIAQCEIDRAYKIICKPSQVSKYIAANIGGDWGAYYEKRKGVLTNKTMTEKMCRCPWVFKGDFLPDVYFRLRWLKKFGRKYDLSKVTYGLLDIEIDVIDRSVDLSNPEDVTQPINAVTLILPHEKICAVHILEPRPEDKLDKSYHALLHKQQKDFTWLQNNKEEFKRMIIEDDPDNKKYLKDYRIDVWTFDYYHEADMIKSVFLYINKYRPMFLMSWNAPFDHNYLKNRLSYKGYDPKEFFIPEGFKSNQLRYYFDRNPKSSIKTSRNWFFVSSFTTYLCQERLFAAIRKSQTEMRSYSLSYVGRMIAKIDKIGHDKFREFAYQDLIKFLLYNVRDVVVQLAIESKCNDCKSLMSRSYMFSTQFSKCFQETHIVRNIREFYYEKIGYIQACKLDVEEGIDTHFKGAFVADPELNAVTPFNINGKYVNNMIFGALDADAKSYYPSTKMGMNLDPMALEYKCIVDVRVFEDKICYNRSFNQEYHWEDNDHNIHDEDIAAYIFNSYKNRNECFIMHAYFGTPSITEYFDAIDARLGVHTS